MLDHQKMIRQWSDSRESGSSPRFVFQTDPISALGFFFHQMFRVRLVRSDHFVREFVRNVVVVRVLHRVRRANLRLRRGIRRVVEHFRERLNE